MCTRGEREKKRNSTREISHITTEQPNKQEHTPPIRSMTNAAIDSLWNRRCVICTCITHVSYSHVIHFNTSPPFVPGKLRFSRSSRSSRQYCRIRLFFHSNVGVATHWPGIKTTESNWSHDGCWGTYGTVWVHNNKSTVGCFSAAGDTSPSLCLLSSVIRRCRYICIPIRLSLTLSFSVSWSLLWCRRPSFLFFIWQNAIYVGCCVYVCVCCVGSTSILCLLLPLLLLHHHLLYPLQ